MTDDATKALLASWYGNLDPTPLDVAESEQDRRRYVDLDAPRGLRGPPVVEKIANAIQLTSYRTVPQSTHLFAGFRGTGKTTELSRLARQMNDGTRSPGFSVLRVSARNYHGLDRALSLEEMAILLAVGIGEAATARLGDTTLPQLQKDGAWSTIYTRLRAAFDNQAITFKLGIADIKPALFHSGHSLREELRKLGEKTHDKLRELLHELVLEIAIALQPRQLIILIDDLDKYTVSTLRVAEVYQEMADLFFRNADLFKLPNCHTIYTVSPYLAFLNQGIAGVFDNLHILPSAKIQGRPPERAPNPGGIYALTSMMKARVDIDQLFGENRDECMQRLVLASGGHLRDLTNLMKRVIELALHRSLPVTIADVATAITEYGAVRTLLKDDVEILLEVNRHSDLIDVEKQRLGAFAGAMDQQLILCYWNGEFWYDTHPIIAAKLERARMLAATAGEGSG